MFDVCLEVLDVYWDFEFDKMIFSKDSTIILRGNVHMSLIHRFLKHFCDNNNKDESSTFDTQMEFCPNCYAKLTMQRGYDKNLPYWICKGCGSMLINPSLDNESDIVWICDQCGALLNIQSGFHEDCGEWVCTECGFSNLIADSEVFASEDEFQEYQKNPYRGLSDEDVLKLSLYQEEEYIDGRKDIIRVTDRDTGRTFIKKLLTVYDRSIYDYLKKNPVDHMPGIIELYESKNCLIVIEEYIQGLTVAQMLENGSINKNDAVFIAEEICRILYCLHHLPYPIIHRDVKPSNIIVTPEREVYLLDVNVAKWYDAEKKSDTRYLGTEEYAAPEQVGYGLSASSEKSDIYAIGVLFNVMLTGKLPKEKQADGLLWNIIERCISLNVADRYDASELINELETYVRAKQDAE